MGRHTGTRLIDLCPILFSLLDVCVNQLALGGVHYSPHVNTLCTCVCCVCVYMYATIQVLRLYHVPSLPHLVQGVSYTKVGHSLSDLPNDTLCYCVLHYQSRPCTAHLK